MPHKANWSNSIRKHAIFHVNNALFSYACTRMMQSRAKWIKFALFIIIINFIIIRLVCQIVCALSKVFYLIFLINKQQKKFPNMISALIRR